MVVYGLEFMLGRLRLGLELVYRVIALFIINAF